MNYYVTIFALLITLRGNAQLSVGDAVMSIQAGVSVTLNGLTLTPSTNLTIANNTIQRNSTPLAGNPSINRLYQFSSSLLFSGTAGITYLPSELNGYTESTLQLAYAPAASTNLTVTTSSTVNTGTHYVANALTNQNLFVVTSTALSDLTSIIYARPTSVYGNSPFTVVVDVFEVNSVPSSGTFVVRVTKDKKIDLSFDGNLTSVNGRPVQNGVWTFDNMAPNHYILTTSQPVAAGDKLSFGLSGMFSPGASSGIVTVSSTVQPITLLEAKPTNNTDADKIEYFQQ